MNVRCDSCETVFRVDPAKVPAEGVRARCSVCANVILVSANGAQPAPAPVESAPPAQAFVTSPPPEQTHVPHTEDRVANSLGDAFIPVPDIVAVELPVSEPTPAAAAPAFPAEEPQPEPEPYVEPEPEVEPEPAPLAIAPEAPTQPIPMVPDPTETVVDPIVEAPAVEAPPPLRLEPSEPAEVTPPAAKPRVSRPFSLPPDVPAVPVRPTSEPRRPTAPVFRPTPHAPVAPAAAPPSSAPISAVPTSAPAAAESTGTSAPTKRPVNPFLSRDPAQKARRLARALISDMIVYQPEKRQKALKEGNLKEAFEEEIRKSWQEYVEQIGQEVADSSNHFNEALNEILAGGDDVF